VHEVIVAGAGPAGSAAASILASQGHSVLLLDKAEFPRDKVCGDGVTVNTIRLLSRMGLSIESRLGEFHLCDRFKAVSTRGHVFEGSFAAYGTGIYMIPRRTLDHLLLEFALRRGVEFEQTRVTGPVVEDGVVRGVRTRSTQKTVERHARITIVADGARSVIARSLKKGRVADEHHCVAMRAYFDGVDGPERRADFYASETGLPGYGWVFPIGAGRANVGIGLRLDALHRHGLSLRQEFDRFVADPRTADRLSQAEAAGHARGWCLPLASNPAPRAYAGALLIGDAGAFVSALTGEGIPRALVSGWLAAQVALEALRKGDGAYQHLNQFEIRWQRALGRRLRGEAVLQRVLFKPGVLDFLLQHMGHRNRLSHLVMNLLSYVYGIVSPRQFGGR
jgi:geranylgeranyl reductase family protein